MVSRAHRNKNELGSSKTFSPSSRYSISILSARCFWQCWLIKWTFGRCHCRHRSCIFVLRPPMNGFFYGQSLWWWLLLLLLLLWWTKRTGPTHELHGHPNRQSKLDKRTNEWMNRVESRVDKQQEYCFNHRSITHEHQWWWTTWAVAMTKSDWSCQYWFQFDPIFACLLALDELYEMFVWPPPSWFPIIVVTVVFVVRQSGQNTQNRSEQNKQTNEWMNSNEYNAIQPPHNPSPPNFGASTDQPTNQNWSIPSAVIQYGSHPLSPPVTPGSLFAPTTEFVQFQQLTQECTHTHQCTPKSNKRQHLGNVCVSQIKEI